eukprot:2472908-Amphidinium_carterae.1
MKEYLTLRQDGLSDGSADPWRPVVQGSGDGSFRVVVVGSKTFGACAGSESVCRYGKGEACCSSIGESRLDIEAGYEWAQHRKGCEFKQAGFGQPWLRGAFKEGAEKPISAPLPAKEGSQGEVASKAKAQHCQVMDRVRQARAARRKKQREKKKESSVRRPWQRQ